jgi:poly(3-hydroxybutyrate) depolymerase
MGHRAGSLVLALAMVAGGAAWAAPAHADPPEVCPPRDCPRLPADGPPALYRAEPTLPKPHGWPASNAAFSRTSGTGRYADGAYYWTDFLYDDHGTTTASTGGGSVTAGTPSFGTYTYPPGPAHNNGADIFRAAVALRPHATYWRVDWTTLADRNVPVAEWAFDVDHNTATGVSDWPGNAGVHSSGIDDALVVSGHGAQLVDTTTGTITRLPVRVDMRAASFVVKLPARLLAPTQPWRVRLAAGLANAAGTAFTSAADAAPDQTAVYNVTFRKRTQEPVSDDYWDDETQTSQLATGDVTPFWRSISWHRLRRHARTSQPRPLGWSDRWYVSAVAPGAGVITDAATVSDGKANYLGRVQPYAIYLPRSDNGSLTFLLHSSNQNHNQYAATTPRFTRGACEKRGSICVSPLGRGPDGGYWGTAELDFWQVWHAVASTYLLDPGRTILAGYSMGGIGANQLAMEHPDLFARSITLAGGVGDIPELANLRWVPTYLAGGTVDELVPVTLQQGEADALHRLSYRFRWVLVSVIDHVTYELADSFADAVRYMGNASRKTHPARFSYAWNPRNTPPPAGVSVESPPGIGWTQRPRLGVRSTGAYWLRDLHARTSDRYASVRAVSSAAIDHAVTKHFSQQVDPTFQPDPATIQTLRWTYGKREPQRPRLRLRLRLRNVASLRVLLRGAEIVAHPRVKLSVGTDGPVTIAVGHRTLRLPAGRHVVRFRA